MMRSRFSPSASAGLSPARLRSLRLGRGLIPFGLVLACTGCDRGEEPAGTVGRSAESPGSAVASDEPLPPLFQGHLPPPTPWLVDNQSRVDPDVDGWPTEALHDLAKHALGAFLGALVSGDVERATAFLADDFEGLTPLVPTALALAYDQGGVRSRRVPEDAVLPVSERLGRDALGAQWAALTSFYEGSPAESHKLTSVDLSPTAGRFTTRALVQLSGHFGRERRQQDLAFDLVWLAARGGDAPAEEDSIRLVAIDLADYSDVALPARPLVDVTASVFGQVDGFADQISRGLEHYQMAWDRIFGTEFLGMHGVAIGDVNGDGLEDVYLCQVGGVPNRLFLRRADGSIVDASKETGLDLLDNTKSALILDFDDDGHRDVALAVEQYVLVCYNDGTGHFPRDEKSRVWLSCPTPEGIYSMTAADPDGDGDLDIYATRYVQGGVVGGYPTPYYDARNGASNHFFRNAGLRAWSDATTDVGLGQNNDRFSLASVWEDFDDDGDPDLYVTNDFGRNNLYENDGRGFFVDVADEAGAADQASGMGATVSDFDLDGDMDIYVSNMFSSAGLRIASQSDKYMSGQNRDLHDEYLFHARGNTLLANKGDGTFQDVTESSGVALGRWAWGALFFDLNNDGCEDIYVPNGFVTNPADPHDL